MTRLPFDDEAAVTFINEARRIAYDIFNQGSARYQWLEAAGTDISGAYAKQFTANGEQEEYDRVSLVHTLGPDGEANGIIEMVETARREADEERAYQKSQTDWQERQDEREREYYEGGAEGHFDPKGPAADRKPAEQDFHPSHVASRVWFTERPRGISEYQSGTSSARPDQLRLFATNSRGANHALDDYLGRLSWAFTQFTTGCPMVVVDRQFLDGFRRIIEQNNLDADWAERLATTFANAGGEGDIATASNFGLTAGTLATSPDDLARMLDRSDVTREQLAQAAQALKGQTAGITIVIRERFAEVVAGDIAGVSVDPYTVIIQNTF